MTEQSTGNEQQKEDLMADLRKQLDELDLRIKSWEAEMKSKGLKAESDAYKRLAEMKERRGELQSRLDKLRESGEGALEELRAGFKSAVDDLRTAFEKAKNEFNK
jgi:chromosome segregation ATPase